MILRKFDNPLARMAGGEDVPEFLKTAEVSASRLPGNPVQRKGIPIFSGVLRYFPDAIAAVAECSRIGNEQHHPGSALHWDRTKSTDEHDALARHLLDAGKVDDDGVRHSAKVAWRALAALQREIDEGSSHG